MKASRLLILLSILTAIGLLAGCQQKQAQAEPHDPWGVVRIPKGQAVEIRLALSQSDPLVGSLGVQQRRGAELAARQFEPIQGFPVSLEVSDPACSSDGGVSAAHDATFHSQTVAVVGMTCSTACLSSAPILDDAHMLEVSPSCEASALTDPVTQRQIFMTTSYKALDEGQLSADFAVKELAANRIAVISYDSVESSDVVNAFKERVAALGGTIVSSSTVAVGQSVYQPVINVAIANKPDLVYAPLFPADAAKLTVQMRNSTLKSTTLLGGRYYLSQWYIDQTRGVSEGVYAVGPRIDNPRSDSIAQAFGAIYREPPDSSEAMYAYDAMELLLDGIKQVAVVGSDSSLLVGRQALKNAILQTASYQAVTGPITCTAWGDCSAPNTLVVAEVKSGNWANVFIP